MPSLCRFTLLLSLICVMGSAAAPPTCAQESTLDVPASVVLETRIAMDADSCPTAVEVWLTSTTDTIQALQLALSWDRPDFARFRTVTLKNPAIDMLAAGDSAAAARSKPDSVSTAPAFSREDGLLSNWEYVEVRGEHGLSLRITAFPYLTTQGDASALLPSDSGLLLSFPVGILPKPPVDILGDSASVGMNSAGTLLSDPNGNLIKGIALRSQSMGAAACWSAHEKR